MRLFSALGFADKEGVEVWRGLQISEDIHCEGRKVLRDVFVVESLYPEFTGHPRQCESGGLIGLAEMASHGALSADQAQLPFALLCVNAHLNILGETHLDLPNLSQQVSHSRRNRALCCLHSTTQCPEFFYCGNSHANGVVESIGTRIVLQSSW